MKELSRQDILDILTGSAILGTGGGGDIEEGLEYIDAAIAADRPIKLATIAELADETMVCTPYLLGALVPSDGDQAAEYARLARPSVPAILTAYQRLESYLGKGVSGMIPCELGGANTALAAYLAAMVDGYLVDADIAGRAVPEITHSTYYLNGLSASPVVMANEFGECFIAENLHDDIRAERIVRTLAVISRNDISVIDHASPLGDVKHAIIPGTISLALQLGIAFRNARIEKQDTADAIARQGKGRVVFRGQVCAANFHDEDGFTLGEIVLQGVDANEGHRYTIGVKNENLISRLDGNVHATIPDLIILVDLESDAPVTNPNVNPGMNAAVVVLPAPAEFLTDRALSVFGPAYVGVDEPFRSVL